jgi:hypothetical protein
VIATACLVVCALLAGLWVRSYSWRDVAYLRLGDIHVQIGSINGTGQFVVKNPEDTPLSESWGLAAMRVQEMRNVRWDIWPQSPRAKAEFSLYHHSDVVSYSFTAVDVPYCFLLILASAMGGLVWFKRTKQFSLRDLLIATTITAMVLGFLIIVY